MVLRRTRRQRLSQELALILHRYCAQKGHRDDCGESLKDMCDGNAWHSFGGAQPLGTRTFHKDLKVLSCPLEKTISADCLTAKVNPKEEEKVRCEP